MTSNDLDAFSAPRSSTHTIPSIDEVEVSLFGPGVGECVVVHLGAGEWIIVDSCIDRATRRPVALDYLTELGVDIGTAVKLVLVSHWHDDHIQGAAEIFQEATSAELWCSAGLSRDEFFAMVSADASALMTSSGTAEFRRILELIEQRARAGARPGSASPRLAKSDVCLYRRSEKAYSVEIHALSPSDGALRLSWHEIAQSIPALRQTKRRAVALQPNQLAVVLWLIVGNVEVLLGADLEESKSPTLGWQAILNSKTRPGRQADVFKVAHHGSESAHSDEVWNRMLKNGPYAFVTPFASGGKFLPTEQDIQRLLSHTSQLYCTAKPGGTRPSRRMGAVEGLANQIAHGRRVIRGPSGHVRLRARRDGSPPAVHCCRGAHKLG